MNEEQNLILQIAIGVVIAILLIMSIIFYYKWNESKKDIVTLTKSLEIERTRSSINKPVETVVERERIIYPKIDAQISQINTNIKNINETVARIEKNRVTKEQINENFKSKTIYEISDYFTANGFNNSVVGK